MNSSLFATTPATIAATTAKTSPNPNPAYVTYFAIAETYVTIVLELSTVLALSTLLFLAKFRRYKLKVSRLSGAMLIYLTVHIIGNATSLPYGVYRIIRWVPTPDRLPNTGMYNPIELYWIGLPEVVYMSIGPLPCFFLTLERIMSLRVSTWSNRLKELIPYLGAAAIVGVYCFNLGVYLLELPLNIAEVFACEFVPCLMVKYRGVPQLFLKMAFGSLNLIMCLFFLRLLKKQASTSIKDRVVRITIFFELFFDMIPTYGGWIFNVVTGESGSRYLGEDISMFVSFETLFCGCYYLWCFYDPNGSRSKPGPQTSSGHQPQNILVMTAALNRRYNEMGSIVGAAAAGGSRVVVGGGGGGGNRSALRRNTVAAVWPVTNGHFVVVGGSTKPHNIGEEHENPS